MTAIKQSKNKARLNRVRRVRAKITGTAARPRLAVFRSAKHVSAQIINDVAGKTLVAVADTQLGKSALKEAGERRGKVAVAYAVGLALAAKAQKAGLASVVFDRAGFAYTGRVAALAQGARDGGLQF